MGDSGTAAIDRIFDLVDGFADKLDRSVGHVKRGDERGKVKVKVGAEQPSAAPAAVTTRPFRVIESIDAETGIASFVVTDGCGTRAECSTRELAEKIRHALEVAP